MSAMQTYSSGIARDNTTRTIEVGGTPADALLSSSRPDEDIWKRAIDQMLRWKTDSSQFEDDDRPDDDILSTAIDYAVDQMNNEMGAPAPSSIVPSGSGRIAMEWNDGSSTVVIEFLALGRASYTRILAGRLVNRHTLIRNPKSRQLELRG